MAIKKFFSFWVHMNIKIERLEDKIRDGIFFWLIKWIITVWADFVSNVLKKREKFHSLIVFPDMNWCWHFNSSGILKFIPTTIFKIDDIGHSTFCKFFSFYWSPQANRPFNLQPLSLKSVEKWFEKSGLRNLVREIWFKKSGWPEKKSGFIP